MGDGRSLRTRKYKAAVINKITTTIFVSFLPCFWKSFFMDGIIVIVYNIIEISVLAMMQEIIDFLQFISPVRFGFNWLDAVILMVIFFYALQGLADGFISSALSLTSFVLSFVLGLKFYNVVGLFLYTTFSIPQSFASAIGFFMAAILGEIIISSILHRLSSRLPKNKIVQNLDKFLGVLPGSLSAIILLSFILTLIISMPVSGVLKQGISSSKLGSFFVSKTQGLERSLNNIFGGTINDTINFLTISPSSEQSVRLNFSTKQLSLDEASEQQMFALVNQERKRQGFNQLVFDVKLREVARAHARDMFIRGYFSHYTPENLSPFDRMANANISFTVAGENLAYAPNVTLAHDGLMKSEGHRKNILSADFGKVGIGVIDGGIYGKMFVQEFTD